LTRDIGRIVLFRGTYLGVHHIGALEEFGFGRTGHQAGDGDAAVVQLVAQRIGKRVQKRLAAAVDGLISPGHQSRDGAGDEDLASSYPMPVEAPVTSARGGIS